MFLFVQAVWSACLPLKGSQKLTKQLFSDAGSGIVFHLNGKVVLNGNLVPKGAIYLPAQSTSDMLEISPGAQFAGIRFQPGVGYELFGEHYQKPTFLSEQMDQEYKFNDLNSALSIMSENTDRVAYIESWLQTDFKQHYGIPKPFEKALQALNQDTPIIELADQVNLGLRQIERQFKQWLNMTPKEYQRLRRVKKAAELIRTNAGLSLVEIAIECGFSDQAHMTREFKIFAQTTPKKS
ncbi:helix-turn-helix domain-containing protein [Marinomonas epiphytica]